jgi:hypothetical protein
VTWTSVAVDSMVVGNNWAVGRMFVGMGTVVDLVG